MRRIIIPLFMLMLNQPSALGQCLEPTAFEYLDVNNVRARINANMRLWWDQVESANYEIPAGSGKHSMFMSNLWFGGVDNGGTIHFTGGNVNFASDYAAGPLNLINAQTSPSNCALYDRIWKLDRWQVAEFRERLGDPGYIIPQDILDWPGNGDQSLGQAFNLAPYIDLNANSVYEPLLGDYPAFSFDEPVQMDFHLLGDQVLWWIVNDNGNIEGSMNAGHIGLEIHCMAYAFRRCDFLQDQTFYSHEVYNRGSNTLSNSFIGLFSDPDLGFYQDDFSASDVQRNMAITYNGTAFDGSTLSGHYGVNPPAVGIDILQGPWMDSDGDDNDGDGTIDNEQHLMSRYWGGILNGGGITSDYQIMQGLWSDGTPLCYGGMGHQNSGCNGTPCFYAFPGDSDPNWMGTGGIPQSFPWSEPLSGNIPFDRRQVQSSGPFTMLPGSVNRLHYGVIWARDTKGTDTVSVQALKATDDLVQAAFDAKFQNLGCCPPEAQITYQRPGTFLFYFTSMWEGDSYFWDFGDGFTSTARFPNHLFPDYGTYNVCLTVTNACGTHTQCMDVEIAVGSTGISSGQRPMPEVRVVPNPATDHVTVLLCNGTCSGYTLLDAMGREVASEMFAAPSVRFEVGLGHLSAGFYTLQAQTPAGPVVVRVVKE
jgi:hypothetical protein